MYKLYKHGRRYGNKLFESYEAGRQYARKLARATFPRSPLDTSNPMISDYGFSVKRA